MQITMQIPMQMKRILLFPIDSTDGREDEESAATRSTNKVLNNKNNVEK